MVRTSVTHWTIASCATYLFLPFDSRLRSEALLKFEGFSRCTDNRFIFELVANSNIIDNSQTAKQMKDLHFKYEIAL